MQSFLRTEILFCHIIVFFFTFAYTFHMINVTAVMGQIQSFELETKINEPNSQQYEWEGGSHPKYIYFSNDKLLKKGASR